MTSDSHRRSPDGMLEDFATRIQGLERRLAFQVDPEAPITVTQGDGIIVTGSGHPYTVSIDPVILEQPPFKPDDWCAHIGDVLTIPTHISTLGGQTTHPSVLYFEEGWNGYHYWMAHTPYPGGNDADEDPNIVASQDGNIWVVPPGLTNPLDNQPGSPGAYNSDTELVMGPDGYMWLIWRTFDSSLGSNQAKLYLRRSLDGITWTTKVLIYQSSSSTRDLVSPTLIYEDGAWTLWGVNTTPSPNVLMRMRSSGPTLTTPSDWGTPVACTIDYVQSGKEPWHIQVRMVRDQYVALMSDATTDVSGTNGDLFLLVSDDGLTWQSSRSVVMPRSGGLYNGLYRASFVVREDGSGYTLDTWYAAWTSSPIVWNVFRTSIAPAGIIGRDTGWINLTQPAGFTDLDGIPSAYRIVDRTVHIRVSMSGTVANGVTYLLKDLPREAWPTAFVRLTVTVNALPAAAMVPPRGHGSAGDVQVYQLTGASRTWASGQISYTLG